LGIVEVVAKDEGQHETEIAGQHQKDAQNAANTAKMDFNLLLFKFW